MSNIFWLGNARRSGRGSIGKVAYGIGPVGELGDDGHVLPGEDGGVEGDDAGRREQLLGVPPVGEPGRVVRHAHGPLVLRHLHVPGVPGHVRGEPRPPVVAHRAKDGNPREPVEWSSSSQGSAHGDQTTITSICSTV
jgi:hypothetical protein